MLRIFQRFLSGLISIAMVLNPIAIDGRVFEFVAKVTLPGLILPTVFSRALADPFMDAAALGSATGSGQLTTPPLSGYDTTSQTFSIPSGNGNAELIQQGQLFSGIDANAQSAVSATMTIAAANNGTGDHAAMTAFTANVTSALATQPTSQGNAYQAIKKSTLAHSHPDMSNDPMLTTSKDVYTNKNNLQNLLGNCTQSTTTVASSSVAHVPNLQQCDRTISPTSCDVQRVVTNVVEKTSCVPTSYLPNTLTGINTPISSTFWPAGPRAPGYLYQPGNHAGQWGSWYGETVCDPYRLDKKVLFHIFGWNDIWNATDSTLAVDVSTVDVVPKYVGAFSSGQLAKINGQYWDWYSGVDTDSLVWSQNLGCVNNLCQQNLIFIYRQGGGNTIGVGATILPIKWDYTFANSCPAGTVSGKDLTSGFIAIGAGPQFTYLPWSTTLKQEDCFTTVNNGSASVGNYTLVTTVPTFNNFSQTWSNLPVPYYYDSSITPVSLIGYSLPIPYKPFNSAGYIGQYVNDSNPHDEYRTLDSYGSKVLTIEYDKPRIVRQVTDMVVETPPNCVNDSYCQAQPGAWTNTGSINDQASTDQWNCVDAANSRIFYGVDVTPTTAQGLTQLYPGVPPSPPAPICYHAQTRNYTCNFNIGQMACFTDAQGVLQCPKNTGGVATTCTTMQADPACSFVSSTCSLADPVTGVCHNFTDTYDCGNNVSVPGTSSSTTTYVCPGAIRCVGTECVNPPPDASNTDFNKAASLLSSTEFMQMDSSCTTAGSCEIFKGKAYDCKKAVGGVQNCCNKPAGVSLVQYIQATYAAWDAVKATETVMQLQAAGQAVVGALTQLGSDLMSNPSDISGALSSAYDSLVGAQAQQQATNTAATTLTQPLYQAMGSFLNSVSAGLGDQLFAHSSVDAAAGNTVFDGGLNTTAGSLGSMLNTVMVAYMYIQLAILLIQLIWACEKPEFELAAKKELRSCHYLGSYCDQPMYNGIGANIGCLVEKESYCCFSSPLARIMQEQGRPQLSLSWGTPQVPECRGYTMQEMAILNFDAMDLSEWVAILAMSGKVPQDMPSADTNYTITRLTSAQSPLAGTTQPVDTPTVIKNTLPNPASGETARSKIRSSMGF